MFKLRTTLPLRSGTDPDAIKRYTISAQNAPVDHTPFLPELARLKSSRSILWGQTPAFAIFHEGATMLYLVLCWWENENELFTVVSVHNDGRWTEDREKYSFCIWDLEVIWHERNSFIRHLYSGTKDLAAYRRDLYDQTNRITPPASNVLAATLKP